SQPAAPARIDRAEACAGGVSTAPDKPRRSGLGAHEPAGRSSVPASAGNHRAETDTGRTQTKPRQREAPESAQVAFHVDGLTRVPHAADRDPVQRRASRNLCRPDVGRKKGGEIPYDPDAGGPYGRVTGRHPRARSRRKRRAYI